MLLAETYSLDELLRESRGIRWTRRLQNSTCVWIQHATNPTYIKHSTFAAELCDCQQTINVLRWRRNYVKMKAFHHLSFVREVPVRLICHASLALRNLWCRPLIRASPQRKVTSAYMHGQPQTLYSMNSSHHRHVCYQEMAFTTGLFIHNADF